MPAHARGFQSLDSSLVTGIHKHHSLLTVQQSMALRDIVDIGRCTDDGVHQARVSIDTNVRLHTEGPLVAFLGFVQHRIPLARAVISRAARCDQRAIDHHSGIQYQVFGN